MGTSPQGVQPTAFPPLATSVSISTWAEGAGRRRRRKAAAAVAALAVRAISPTKGQPDTVSRATRRRRRQGRGHHFILQERFLLSTEGFTGQRIHHDPSYQRHKVSPHGLTGLTGFGIHLRSDYRLRENIAQHGFPVEYAIADNYLWLSVLTPLGHLVLSMPPTSPWRSRGAQEGR